ncbi:MAG TPA: sigma-54 dependent transcriptional regulator [Salegentibacter sp.]|nr:sigma-54 dependent transcriptional regulator [Salegentibacter sp.]
MPSYKENILIVDDDFDMLEVLQRNLKAENYHVYKASSVLEAIDILRNSLVELLITDLQMPGLNGMELIKFASDHYPDLPKLVITGFPSVDGAVEAVQAGALDYLSKPFTKSELLKAVHTSLQKSTLSPKKEYSRTSEDKTYAGMVGQSPEFQKIIDLIERVKNNRATILIQGESGTGKELVARAIHYKGSYAANPFIAVNCGAIPENLLESELFGFVKGAFTGANETRPGYFQAANGGTIFLDEIGTASQAVQVSLLRVLQEKEVRMLGARNTEKVELRIIAATNSDLFEMVRNGSFREDLYYRLNVVDISLPPLRERKEDIVTLADTFLKKYKGEYGKSELEISSRAIEILKKYDWPGNIRELENAIQRAIIMSENIIDADQLPSWVKHQLPEEESRSVSLKEIEKQHILKVLALTQQNKTKAAELLGIDRKTLREKLK